MTTLKLVPPIPPEQRFKQSAGEVLYRWMTEPKGPPYLAVIQGGRPPAGAEQTPAADSAGKS